MTGVELGMSAMCVYENTSTVGCAYASLEWADCIGNSVLVEVHDGFSNKALSDSVTAIGRTELSFLGRARSLASAKLAKQDSGLVPSDKQKLTKRVRDARVVSINSVSRGLVDKSRRKTRMGKPERPAAALALMPRMAFAIAFSSSRTILSFVAGGTDAGRCKAASHIRRPKKKRPSF